MTTQPYFSSIRNHILTALEKADKSIQAAVCWFTNDELFNLLCRKLQAGVKVEVIILNDYINSNPYGCDFTKLIQLGGGLYLSDVENPMHNKYCIIDNSTLINGSYNWTYYAETKNEENIIVFEQHPELIKAFSSDFDRLKSITAKSDVFKRKSLLEFENASNEDKRLNVFSSFNMLSNDLFLKAVSTNNKVYYEAAKKITPDNISFQKKAVQLTWDKPVILKSTLGEEIKDNKLSIIFEKGREIPCENVLTFHTVKDKQVEASMTVWAGEDEAATKNSKIGTYKLVGIPELDAGVGTIKTEYKISIAGILYITNYIHDTGLLDRRTFDLKRNGLLVNE